MKLAVMPINYNGNAGSNHTAQLDFSCKLHNVVIICDLVQMQPHPVLSRLNYNNYKARNIGTRRSNLEAPDTLVREGKSCVKISRTTELKSKYLERCQDVNDAMKIITVNFYIRMCNILPDRGRVPWKRVDGRQDTFMWNL
ncbi:hypothetical protein Tsp_05066 [Trichinella spiralis]|uniref:hypothetical protein n=1 Tax=Trichinella spiralis TaxID=6334 RepID=UPI0001EFECF8|nr:hypothetical protein Tsp_05066 [Trichinella spiralis]